MSGFIVWALILTGTARAEPVVTLTFGIVPQQAPKKIARKWAPVLNYLGEKTGYNFVLKTAPSIPEFERRLSAGEYDLAYMNPYHYVVFRKAPGYLAFAKQKDRRIKGIVVVRKDAPFERLADLDKKTLAFPSPAAFAASVLPRAFFRDEGIQITPKYVKSHDSVYRAVAKGLYPAGGGVVRTLKNMDQSIRDQLRVLWTTSPFTPHSFASHPRVPEKVIGAVKRAMLAMEKDPAAEPLLKALNFQGFEGCLDSDWDDVRALKIDELEHLVKN